jgi:hypothetical protein
MADDTIGWKSAMLRGHVCNLRSNDTGRSKDEEVKSEPVFIVYIFDLNGDIN